MSRYEAPTVTLLGLVHSGGGDGVDTRVVDVESVDGWKLVITSHGAGGYDATITSPAGSAPYASKWRRTLAEAVEKACDYVRDRLGKPDTADALRLMARVQRFQ